MHTQRYRIILNFSGTLCLLKIDKEKNKATFELLLELCLTDVTDYKYISCCSYEDAIAFLEMGYDMRVKNLLLHKPSPFFS